MAGVDAVHLLHPSSSFPVGQRQNFIVTPAQPYCDEGYLLVQAFEGVAYDSPSRGTSTSKVWLQLGQVTAMTLSSTSLIRL